MYGKFEEKLFRKLFREEGSEEDPSKLEEDFQEPVDESAPTTLNGSTTWKNPDFDKMVPSRPSNSNVLICEGCSRGATRLYSVNGKDLCGNCKRGVR